MKKLFLILLIIFSLISCKKDKKYCWECVMIHKINDTVIKVINSENMICDKTEDEIKVNEQQGSGKINYPPPNSYTEEFISKCHKK